MSPERMRVVIAEACGWSFDHINRHAMFYVPSIDAHVGDPLNDLNACAEMALCLGRRESRAYAEELWMLCETPAGDIIDDYLAIACATAAQRCEAFLKTIGKWEVEL